MSEIVFLSSPEEKSILNAVFPIDDSVPMTEIQIMLADEGRLIQRCHSTHRILDVPGFFSGGYKSGFWHFRSRIERKKKTDGLSVQTILS